MASGRKADEMIAVHASDLVATTREWEEGTFPAYMQKIYLHPISPPRKKSYCKILSLAAREQNGKTVIYANQDETATKMDRTPSQGEKYQPTKKQGVQGER